MEKSEFRVLIKHCFLMEKNTVQVNQWLDKCFLNAAVQTPMMLNTLVAQFGSCSRKHKKKSTKTNFLSHESIRTILNDCLRMKRIAARLVPKDLTHHLTRRSL